MEIDIQTLNKNRFQDNKKNDTVNNSTSVLDSVSTMNITEPGFNTSNDYSRFIYQQPSVYDEKLHNIYLETSSFMLPPPPPPPIPMDSMPTIMHGFEFNQFPELLNMEESFPVLDFNQIFNQLQQEDYVPMPNQFMNLPQIPPPFPMPCDPCYGYPIPPQPPAGFSYIDVELIDIQLWRAFNSFGNEMIITKTGRRTFPYFNVRVTGLTTGMKYLVQLAIEPVNMIRWKYAEASGWQPNKHEIIDVLPHIISHTDSGKTGEYLDGKILSFKYIKLSNHFSNKDTHFCLKSMHYYTFRLIISAVLSHNNCMVVYNNTFDECNFFAVTAYQNKVITDLKIQKNPYAKGFLGTDKKSDNDERDEPAEKIAETPRKSRRRTRKSS